MDPDNSDPNDVPDRKRVDPATDRPNGKAASNQDRRSVGDGSQRKMNPRRHSNDVTERRLEEEGSNLTEEELHQIDDRLKLRPLAIYEIVRQEGEDELTRQTASLIWSGLAAGLSIGFSVYTQAALRAYLPDAPWRPLVECLGYSVGFVIVILGRQQLFTEITLTAALPVIARPSIRGIVALLRLWAIVFAANMVGTIVFAGGIALDILDTPAITGAAIEISRATLDSSALSMLMRGIAAGWLIATVVWILPSAQAAGIWVIVLLTYLIALFHLAHIVAGSVEAATLVLTGNMTVSEVLFGFYIPALAGNVLGGAALFALISYGQVAQELEETSG